MTVQGPLKQQQPDGMSRRGAAIEPPKTWGLGVREKGSSDMTNDHDSINSASEGAESFFFFTIDDGQFLSHQMHGK